jgi:hypothetical protein
MSMNSNDSDDNNWMWIAVIVLGICGAATTMYDKHQKSQVAIAQLNAGCNGGSIVTLPR